MMSMCEWGMILYTRIKKKSKESFKLFPYRNQRRCHPSQRIFGSELRYRFVPSLIVPLVTCTGCLLLVLVQFIIAIQIAHTLTFSIQLMIARSLTQILIWRINNASSLLQMMIMISTLRQLLIVSSRYFNVTETGLWFCHDGRCNAVPSTSIVLVTIQGTVWFRTTFVQTQRILTQGCRWIICRIEHNFVD